MKTSCIIILKRAAIKVIFIVLISSLFLLFIIEPSYGQENQNFRSLGLKTGISLPVGSSGVPYILLGLEFRTIWPSGLDIGINGDLQVDTDFPYGDGLASLMGMVHYHIPSTSFYTGIGLARYSILSYQTHKVFGFPIDLGILYRKLNFNIKYIYISPIDEGTVLWNYSHLSFTVGWWFSKNSKLP